MNINQIINKCVELKAERGDFDDFIDSIDECKSRMKNMLIEMHNDGQLTKVMAYRRLLELKEEMEQN